MDLFIDNVFNKLRKITVKLSLQRFLLIHSSCYMVIFIPYAYSYEVFSPNFTCVLSTVLEASFRCYRQRIAYASQ